MTSSIEKKYEDKWSAMVLAGGTSVHRDFKTKYQAEAWVEGFKSGFSCAAETLVRIVTR